MKCPRESAIEELQRTIASDRELRAAVRSQEALIRKMVKALENGVGVSEMMHNAESQGAKAALTEAHMSWERMRHRARVALCAAGLAEGMSIGEIGRVWGISRQLASRYAKEARGEL